MKIVFKNLESSELARQIVQDRIGPIISKFRSLIGHNVTVTLEMENSPLQPGPDLFTVSILINGSTHKFLKMEKADGNLYHAVAMVADGIFELLSKANDRIKTQKKSQINTELVLQRDYL